MRFPTPNIASLLLIALWLGPTSYAMAKSKELRFYAVMTGANVCLDIFGGEDRRTPTMAECGDFSGQAWWLVDTNEASHVKLKNSYSGTTLCLDISTVGKSHVPIMAECGHYSGQYWKLEANTTGKDFKLKNTFSGDALCLDIIKLGKSSQLVMAPCKQLTGQMWRNAPY